MRGGNNTAEGDVFAVNSLGIFGQVCDDLWTDEEATVVCRQLGYSYGYATIESHFGAATSADYVMDDVACAGTEESLQRCTYNGTAENCSADDGAGVYCY